MQINKTIKLKKNEEKIFPVIWFGEQDQTLNLKVILDQPGSSLKILGLFWGTQHHFELNTEVIHRAPETFSRTIIKGVLDGTASVNFEGRILIEKGAKNADGDLKGHIILLSKKARATAIPSLEVQENEVKAGHGATVGKIDEEQLFYLNSRGLDNKQAKQVIIQGFLGSLLSEFPKKEALNISKMFNLDLVYANK